MSLMVANQMTVVAGDGTIKRNFNLCVFRQATPTATRDQAKLIN